MVNAMSALVAVLGALVGGTGMAAALLPARRRQQQREADMMKQLAKLSHDLRGALAPGLLMAERLEQHPDPTVRQSVAVIMTSMERASALITGSARPDNGATATPAQDCAKSERTQ
jgi:signal transduction histidine kinase